MVYWFRKSATRWILTAALGIIAGVGFWWWTVPRTMPGAGSARGIEGVSTPGVAEPGSASETSGVVGNPVAVRYATAFQQGAWDEIVNMTCWMQQRLMRVQIESGSPVAREEARAELRKRVSNRYVEGNQLRPEGVEDQYVFVSDAMIELVGLDAGRPSLEQPTKDRTWMRVSYPSRRSALRDDKGIPIRSITVGVNVSTGDLVLKANVIGNLDIDRNSISYDWEKAGGSRKG